MKSLEVIEENKTIMPSTQLSIVEVKEKILQVKQLYQEVLIKDEHYGKIPGTKKDTLYKAGAEKLTTMFCMVNKIEKEDIIELTNNHREYRIIIGLYNRQTGIFYGQGLGSCSTMETKFRYRHEDMIGAIVDRGYWNARNNDSLNVYFDKYPERKDCNTKKIDGQWHFVKKGKRIENEDIADVWNTVYKMAFKRALVSAVITATGVSDIFTQDLEDNKEYTPNQHSNNKPVDPKNPIDIKIEKEKHDKFVELQNIYNEIKAIISAEDKLKYENTIQLFKKGEATIDMLQKGVDYLKSNYNQAFQREPIKLGLIDDSDLDEIYPDEEGVKSE